ncbi:hypothetical protein TZ01_07270 [Acidiplasma sp. MBA-1]|nr:hypothetical protein TZ01_07270 [Acidiplasma sp. MBA-1]
MMHGGRVHETARENGFNIKSIIDFSSSMNDFIKLPEITMGRECIENYPDTDYEYYKNYISGGEFKKDNILIVPGLTYFIHRIMLLSSGNIIIITPTFNEYLYARSNSKKVEIPLYVIQKNPYILKNYNFNSIFIVYPSSPTGELMEANVMNAILNISLLKNARVFLDESFIYFSEKRPLNEISLINKYGNLFVCRSLTKAFSIPGLRIAYVASAPENIIMMEHDFDPWRMSSASLKYISKINYNNLAGLPEMVTLERNYIIKRMMGLGFTPVGKPVANYITFKAPEHINILDLDKFLKSNGILIRILDDYKEFGTNYIRISVKRRNKNVRLISKIKEYMGDLYR